MSLLVRLPDRGVIEVGGEDRVAFLQGLVSNDVEQVRPGVCVWAALLTPQGKWLADFFVYDAADALLLDCESGQIPMLTQRLTRFRLRSKVAVGTRDGLSVYATIGPSAPIGAGEITEAADPRHPEAGRRILSSGKLEESGTFDEWDYHRLGLGLPDGSRDLEAEKTVLIEAGFDELNGISWTKGCYMGQELTARTRYRGLVKRRLMPVEIDGGAPSPGTPVLRDGVEVGTMRSSRDERGLALLRIEVSSGVLTCGDALLHPRIPEWMKLPEQVK